MSGMACCFDDMLDRYWDLALRTMEMERVRPVIIVGRVEMGYYAEQLGVEMADRIETDQEIFQLCQALECDCPVEYGEEFDDYIIRVVPVLHEQQAPVRVIVGAAINHRMKRFFPVGLDPGRVRGNIVKCI